MKITTKKYVNNQVKWLRREMKAQFDEVRRAVDKVETTNIAKFEAQNEWRGQFKDQASTFVTGRVLWAVVIALLGILFAAMQYFK